MRQQAVAKLGCPPAALPPEPNESSGPR
jgi:hypothetical protein